MLADVPALQALLRRGHELRCEPGVQRLSLARAPVEEAEHVALSARTAGALRALRRFILRRQPDVHEMGAKSLPATCFPTASCLASTWDVNLASRMGEALAEECIAQNVDVLLGPGANMKRSPLGGRNFEYYSEDPLVAGRMAAAAS